MSETILRETLAAIHANNALDRKAPPGETPLAMRARISRQRIASRRYEELQKEAVLASGEINGWRTDAGYHFHPDDLGKPHRS
jgi:hypothetical protein